MSSRNTKKHSTGNSSDYGSTDTGSMFGDRFNDGESIPVIGHDEGVTSFTITDQNAASANSQNQFLQEFIVPLIRMSNRRRTNEMNQTPSGPEAEQLINALQGLISSIVGRSRSGSDNTIEVPLNDGELQDDVDSDESDNESSDEGSFGPDLSSSDSDGDAANDDASNVKPISDKVKQEFRDELLKSLRRYVDNKLPFRLLAFERRGSALQISLLEKAAIYKRLESQLDAKMQEPGFRPKLSAGANRQMEPNRNAIGKLISEHTRYAILSHTWLRPPTSGELSYSDWNTKSYDARSPGYQKLVDFCKTAWKAHGLAFGWMDTVCINKTSSTELDESIRSMFKWYNRAHVCITYLADTGTLSDMPKDTWFTRGWTLQELLAPDSIVFYNSDWRKLGGYSKQDDKIDSAIARKIREATTMSKEELRNILEAPISRRMELAAKRHVTREEDSAYSLMGIFNVSISTAYGEGEQQAFFRLLQEILGSSTYVLDIFNWAGKQPRSRPHRSFILPTSLRCYRRRSNNPHLMLSNLWPVQPLTLTHQGLHIPVILMPGVSVGGRGSSNRFPAVGEYRATVDISPIDTHFPTKFNLLAASVSDADDKHEDGVQRTFAVFNFDGDATNIRISGFCTAICLKCDEKVGKVSPRGNQSIVPTKKPIVFELNKIGVSKKSSSDDDDDDYYEIKQKQLASHGMQFISLYL